jgi:glycosyltransferase involved in cell wall biosynthesis
MNRRANLVSTIIPVFNRPALLTEAVASVLTQTHRPIEIIIVDDGSTDETPIVAKDLAERHPELIRYVRKERGGCAHARNAGLSLAAGEFIQLLDSDDLLLPEKFALQIRGLREHPECGLSYCSTREYRFGDCPTDRAARRSGESFTELFPALLSGRIWGFPAPLFRAAAIAGVGPFAEALTFADWEFECRLAAEGVRAHHRPEFLAETRLLHKVDGKRSGRPRVNAVRDSAAMHEAILGHARRAGVSSADLDTFARRMFAVARQCASVGLQAEAKRSVELALEIVRDPWRARRLRAYRAAAETFGWHATGWTSEGLERYIPPIGRALDRGVTRWRRRAAIASQALAGTPVLSWPGRLRRMWNERPSRAAQRGAWS